MAKKDKGVNWDSLYGIKGKVDLKGRVSVGKSNGK